MCQRRCDFWLELRPSLPEIQFTLHHPVVCPAVSCANDQIERLEQTMTLQRYIASLPVHAPDDGRSKWRNEQFERMSGVTKRRLVQAKKHAPRESTEARFSGRATTPRRDASRADDV
jgi:hypothetical protein